MKKLENTLLMVLAFVAVIVFTWKCYVDIMNSRIAKEMAYKSQLQRDTLFKLDSISSEKSIEYKDSLIRSIMK